VVFKICILVSGISLLGGPVFVQNLPFAGFSLNNVFYQNTKTSDLAFVQKTIIHRKRKKHFGYHCPRVCKI